MTLVLTAILAATLVAVPGVSDPTPDPAPPTVDSTTYTFDNANSSMTVYGSSNVRDWTMDVTRIDGGVVLGSSDGALPSIQNVRVEVSVNALVSDKDRLQSHAHDALEKEDYPTISFASSSVEVTQAEADSFSVRASGKMTIKGNTHPVDLMAKGAQRSDGTLHIVGDHSLNLSTYEVERPSLMFGAIKVTDPVRIGFDVILTPESSTADVQ